MPQWKVYGQMRQVNPRRESSLCHKAVNAIPIANRASTCIFLGPFVHGGTADRFLYLSWRPKDWHPGGPEVPCSTWLRRMKVRLGSIIWPQIEQAVRQNGVLEKKVASTGLFQKQPALRAAGRSPAQATSGPSAVRRFALGWIRLQVRPRSAFHHLGSRSG